MYTVGPTSRMNSSRAIATTMLKLLRNWTPLPTPEIAEATNASVSTAMIATASPVDVSTSQTKLSPLLICSAPSPSEVALPNIVAKMARMSMPLPIGPFTRSPSSGRNAELIRFGMPLRKQK
jgi:hypothetical protein